MKFVFALIWALLGVPLSFMASGSKFLLALAIALFPITLTVWSNRREKAIANKHFDELLRLAGIPRIQGLNHLELGTGVAIDREKRKSALVAEKDARAYSFDDVRSWEARKGQKSGRAVGYGVQGTLTAGAANLGDAHRSDEETGFFVKVRDAELAEWRISVFDAADRSRWMEIFNQAFSRSDRGGQSASA